jgi:hypothetical protein
MVEEDESKKAAATELNALTAEMKEGGVQTMVVSVDVIVVVFRCFGVDVGY